VESKFWTPNSTQNSTVTLQELVKIPHCRYASVALVELRHDENCYAQLQIAPHRRPETLWSCDAKHGLNREWRSLTNLNHGRERRPSGLVELQCKQNIAAHAWTHGGSPMLGLCLHRWLTEVRDRRGTIQKYQRLKLEQTEQTRKRQIIFMAHGLGSSIIAMDEGALPTFSVLEEHWVDATVAWATWSETLWRSSCISSLRRHQRSASRWYSAGMGWLARSSS
jgi:hypothetical protein